MDYSQLLEFLPDKEAFLSWIAHNGSFALFILFALGIIALPVPEESLMVLAGILISQDNLPFFSTVIACIAGSFVGITVSYFLGRTAGHYFLIKYGKWFFLDEEKLEQTRIWFKKYGKWTLFFGYFIPGVRHFTGIFAGMSELPYNQFSLFAYSGGLLWATTFISIGYFFGDYWLKLYEVIESGLEFYFIGFLLLILFFYLLKKKN